MLEINLNPLRKANYKELEEMAENNKMSISALIAMYEYRENELFHIFYSTYNNKNIIDWGESNYYFAKKLCNDEDAPDWIQAFIITKDYIPVRNLLRNKIEDYSNNNNIQRDKIEKNIILEIMEDVSKQFQDARFIKFC